MSQDVPTGRRFSHVYLDRGKPTADSGRMRVRLYEVATDHEKRDVLAEMFRRELGVQVYSPGLREFFSDSPIHDVLDSVTVIYGQIRKDRYRGINNSAEFIGDVERIFREENVGYRVDQRGGVHFALDEEFERIRVTALQGLGKPRYGAVRHEFEMAYVALDVTPPDTKTAVRAAFESVEILFKLLVDDTKCQRLGVGEIGTFLKPRVEKVYGAEPTAKQATKLLADSMADWVSAVHFYRHGQAVQEPAPPPLEVCVVMLSQAATYLRWLIELDERLSASGGQAT